MTRVATARGEIINQYAIPQAALAPESKRSFHCYATHEKGYGHGPLLEGADIRILLVNAARDVLWADSRFDGHDYLCEVTRLDAQWMRLGWVMTDGSQPL